MVAAIDRHFEQRFSNDQGLIVTTTETLVDNRETADYASLDAGGTLTVDVTGTTTLTTYGTDGGAADPANVIYPEQLLEQDGLTLLTEDLVEEYFHEKKVTLSPAFKALVLAAVGFVNPLGLTGAFAAMTNTLIVGGIEFAITGQLDVGALLKDVVFAGTSSALTNFINLETFIGEIAKNSPLNNALLGFGDDLTLRNILDGVIDNVITSGLSSVVYGTNFFDSFLSSMASTVVNLAVADFQTLIGDIGVDIEGWEGSAGHAALHSLVGCAGSVLTGGNCASGAIGGLIQSVYAGAIAGTEPKRDQFGSDEAFNNAYASWRKKHLELVSLLGSIGGFLTSGGEAVNVNIAGRIARSGLENNYLTHEENSERIAKQKACNRGNKSACDRVAELNQLDLDRDNQVKLRADKVKIPT